MTDFTVYPAIDLRNGGVVRLGQGDYSRETRYAGDPLALACDYAAAGADWLHLVDLDGARLGGYSLAALLSAIRSGTALRVQTGGGVRSVADVESLLDAGADRVVVGSLAVRTPDAVLALLERIGPDRLVLALDTRRDAAGRWRLPVDGWTRASEADLFERLELFAASGLRHLLCTDIERDGMLTGPNLPLYRQLVARFPGLLVQASGGARSLSDIAGARRSGCGGIVLGRALLEGRFGIAEALSC
jgi:phosphoribosylformimino-5-aminoimidazole carboxamide ribotide isomerase